MTFHIICCLVLAVSGVYTLSIPTNDQHEETQSLAIPADKMKERLALLPAIFMMSEEVVSLVDRKQCMEKMVCLLENNLPESASNSLFYLSKYLTNKHHDLDDASFARVKMLLRNYPLMERLVAAITLAQSHDDPEICSVRFPECDLSADGLISAARMFDDEAILRTGLLESGPGPLGQATGTGPRVRRNWPLPRSDFGEAGCKINKVSCYTMGVGCSICSIFSAGICAAFCIPLSALPCGATLACDLSN